MTHCFSKRSVQVIIQKVLKIRHVYHNQPHCPPPVIRSITIFSIHYFFSYLRFHHIQLKLLTEICKLITHIYSFTTTNFHIREMTAYGAVLSLRNTINNILRCSRFSLVARSQQIMDVVYKELDSLHQILERLDETSPSKSRKKVNALDGRIKEALWKFEDSLESLLTNTFYHNLKVLERKYPLICRVWNKMFIP